MLEDNFTVSLELEGGTLVAHRDMMDHQFLSSGDFIKFNKFSDYNVRIKKKVFVKDDPNRNCRNYPDEEFASCMECDDQSLRKEVEALAPGIDLLAVWLDQDLDSRVTTETILLYDQVQSKKKRIHQEIS